MKSCLDAEKLCRDIILEEPNDVYSTLKIIESQPCADATKEIFDILKKIRIAYMKNEDFKSASVVKYSIFCIEKHLKNEKQCPNCQHFVGCDSYGIVCEKYRAEND